jgi:hypothetical protein
MTVQELLSDESKWTTYTYARNVDGARVNYASPDAVCWCVLGAIRKCYPDSAIHYQDILEKTIQKLTSEFHTAADYNDYDSTTFADIQNLIKEANI